MFSFGEIALTLIVALFVLGPERLPKVAVSLGRYWVYANRYLDKIRAEIHQAIENGESEDVEFESDNITRSNFVDADE